MQSSELKIKATYALWGIVKWCAIKLSSICCILRGKTVLLVWELSTELWIFSTATKAMDTSGSHKQDNK